MPITIPPVVLQHPVTAKSWIEAVQESVRGVFLRDRSIHALSYMLVQDHPDTVQPLEHPMLLAVAAETDTTEDDRRACSCVAREVTAKLRTLGVAFVSECWGVPLGEGYRVAPLSTRPKGGELILAILAEHRTYEGIIKGWRARVHHGSGLYLGPWLSLPPLLVNPDILVLNTPHTPHTHP